MMKTCLLDTNVWIALAFESHEHHIVALGWFTANVSQQFGFCRTTQHGFLRIATNRKAMGGEALSLPEAWVAYDSIMSDDRVVWIEEPLGLETEWRSLTADRESSPKIWTDAYLAAFVRVADLEMLTLDRGFERYELLHLTCLLH